jgi:hypothetical protein
MSRISRLSLLLGSLLVPLSAWQFHNRPPGTGVISLPAQLPADEVTCRILLGLTDTESTRWDGSLSVTSGTVVRLEPWRFDDGDTLQDTSWKLSTHRARAFGGGQQQPGQQPQGERRQQQQQTPQQQPAPQQSAQQQATPPQPAQPQSTQQQQPPPQQPQPVVANGVVATLRNFAGDSEVHVTTRQGNFQFRLSEISYGKSAKFLNGRVMVDQVPASAQITTSRDEQDYPAATVDRDGNVWVAFLQFAINPKFQGIRMAVKEPPKNMSELAEAPGGDQVFLMRYSRGAWSEPIAVSEARGDLYRPAIAVDGSDRVWVFWSANQGGNFDLYARSFRAGKGERTVRLTTDRGADILPVAATDAHGQVWVAWQAFRGGRSQIHAVRQRGNSFSGEMVVASSAGNEWNPSIAASSSGAVAVAWDSYRKGDYDVYLRVFDAGGHPGSEVAVAASARYEAYPSLAFDGTGRLWIAWEESDAGWGKDFGAYESSGIGLYQGRWIRTKVWHDGGFFAAGKLDSALPGTPNRNVDSAARQSDSVSGTQPDSNLAKNRQPTRGPQPPPRPMNNLPRLLADRSGRIWLAYRTAQPTWWTAIGTVWFENVVSFDGESWTNPIFVVHSDNLLDNRPALVSTGPGELLIIRSSDGRQQFHAGLRNSDIPAQQFAMERDPYNNDLYASRISLPGTVKPAKLDPVPAETPAAAGSPDTAELRRLRAYRTQVGSMEYRILRGEFHRHTEISMDAGRDGTLWDAWRYAIDAAALDWIGCCDHDNGFGREYTWWTTQKLTDLFLQPGAFTPMFNYERSVAYPEGHRNVIFAQRGVRTLPRLPKVNAETPGGAPDTKMLYDYLRHFNGIVASHTSATNMGTDWRDNDALLEPIVEIYQGDRQNYEMPQAPRSNSEKDSIGGWRPKGFVSLALLDKGYRLGFQSSSDHISTHMSYCNLFVTAPTREAVLDAFKKRHVYAATDDILAEVRSGDHMMGDQFESTMLPALKVKLMGTGPFAKVSIIKDNRYVYTNEPKKAAVEFTWVDNDAKPGKTSYYYIRGEQKDGELVWVSPMWITYRAP